MSTDTHVFDLLPAYALGCLDDDEVGLVSDHLADCPTCQAELQTYQRLSQELAFAAPDATPPPALRDKLMAAIQPAPPTTRSSPRLSWWQAVVGAVRRPVPAWSLIGVLLILVVATAYLWLWPSSIPSPIDRFPDTMQTIALHGTETAPEAQGIIVISSDGAHGALVVEDLPLLDLDHQYQLWLIKDGQRTNGGVFSVDSNGRNTMTIRPPNPLDSYSAFGVTIEPAGGSPGPTGDKVLGSVF